MKKIVYIMMMACAAVSVQAQDSKSSYFKEHNIFQHLDVSVNAGTSGIGFDVASPIGDYVQLRAGYEFMPQFRFGVDFPVEVGGEPAVVYDENGHRIETRFDRLAKNLKEITGFEVEDHVEMMGKMTMNNFKLLVDVFPFKENKHWHFTGGFYWGPSQFARADNSIDAMVSLIAVDMYNNMYDRVENFWETGEPIMNITIGGEPYSIPELSYNQVMTVLNYGRMGFALGEYKEDMYSQSGLLIHKKGDPYVLEPGDDHQVHVYAKPHSFKPYLGFGYGGRLLKNRDDWKVSFDAGVMFWGKPDLYTHDGTNLTKDVENVLGKVGDFVDFFKGLVVYPTVSVRFTKTIF
jgi:hypothetical protein